MPEDTVEGAELALAIGPTIEALLAGGKLDGSALPLLRAVIDVVCHEARPEIPWETFFARV
jgi:glycerol-3-phosphate dehydrogenase (NAD(P)+)